MKKHTMKQLSVTLLFFMLAATASAQLVDPVKWAYGVVKRPAGVYDVTLTAAIDEGWHIYSQLTSKDGPAPTKITFKTNPLLSVGKGFPREIGKIKKEIDKTFGKPIEIVSFSDKVQFVQAVSRKAKVTTNIAGTITYEVCNDRRCAQFKTAFDVLLD